MRRLVLFLIIAAAHVPAHADVTRRQFACSHQGDGFVAWGGINGAVELRPSVSRSDCGQTSVASLPPGSLLMSTTGRPQYVYCAGEDTTTFSGRVGMASEARTWIIPVTIERAGGALEFLVARLWVGRVHGSRYLGWSCDPTRIDNEPYEGVRDGFELCPGLFLKKKHLTNPELEFRASDGARVCVPATELEH